MDKNGRKKKVFVGLSGGVDSSVSAGLLKEAGFDVTGVFIKVWQPDWIECTWKEDRRDAMRVCAHLDIPFITLDLENEYKSNVIDYMIHEYQVGRTPNPDIMCNRYVKFGGFLKWAEKQGADYISTGHYARVETREFGAEKVINLLVGIDTNKDQSYFLWTLNQKDLSKVIFPVGNLTKPEVRKLARKFSLPTATKKDSQGLCFIGKVDLKDFLSHYVESKEGNVLNEKGEIIGIHPGALFFTNGERHGFKVFNKTPNDLPYFVIDKDLEQNTITVSNKDNGILPGAIKTVTLSGINWIQGKVPDFRTDLLDFPFEARVRYRQPLQKIRIVSINITEVTIEFQFPQESITPGQSLVIYNGDICLGGGIIE